MQPYQTWAAWYHTCRLNKLMLKGVVFSFLLFSFQPCQTWSGVLVTGVARQPIAGQRRQAGQHCRQGPAHATGLPPPMSTLNPGQVSGSSWGAYAGNVAARRLVWEVRGPHQAQGVVRMVAGLRPLADGTTGLYLAHPST